MTDRDALQEIRPRTRRDWRQIWLIVCISLASIISFLALIHVLQSWEQSKEQGWKGSIATVEDVRGQLAEVVDSRYGGRLLYNIQVLAEFQVDGVMRRQWITVGHGPRSSAELNFDRGFWIGKKYQVRWNPANPSQAVIDLQ